MLTDQLENLIAIANRAVDVAIETLRSASGHGELTAKGDRDYATEVDYRIEHRVRDFLSRETPEIGFLGEEEGLVDPGRDLRWALDPIDGTVNFVHGLPLHAVSLGLVEGNQPVLGVIDIPAWGARYRASKGLGAYRGETRLSCPAPPVDLSAAVVALGDYAVGVNADVKNELRLAVTNRLARVVLRVRMLGSAAIDLAWLAEGRLDASITLSNNVWDMAAGVVLARETGHSVVDRNAHDYDLGASATIAAHPKLLPDLLPALRPHT